MQCRNHPDQKAVAVCEKFSVGYCSLCCEGSEEGGVCGCSSPRQHCRFRTQCLVWALSKERKRREGILSPPC